jgi:hypothetical protein
MRTTPARALPAGGEGSGITSSSFVPTTAGPYPYLPGSLPYSHIPLSAYVPFWLMTRPFAVVLGVALEVGLGVAPMHTMTRKEQASRFNRIVRFSRASSAVHPAADLKLAGLPWPTIRANLRIAPQEAIECFRNKLRVPRNARTGTNENSCELNRGTGT